MKAVILTAATELRPYQQGDSDALCGLYALLNAIRIAVYPKINLTHSDIKRLFVDGVGILSVLGHMSEVLSTGMKPSIWIQLCNGLTASLEGFTGVTLQRSFFLRSIRGTQSRQALMRIKRTIRNGSPVLMLLGGSHDHYTVAVGYTHDRIILFDSAKLRWIYFRTTGLNQDSCTKRNQIDKWSAMGLGSEPVKSLRSCV